MSQKWECYVCKTWYESQEEKDACMESHGQVRIRRGDGGYDWFPRKA